MIAPWLRHPIRYARLHRLINRSRRAAIVAGLIAGVCVEFSPRGFICTVHEPHREHVAVHPDGRVLERWISRQDMPA